jgi:hypothetical protein
MDENLLGYLLDALEPREQRDVEVFLHDHPEAQDRLEVLRHALEPLAADRDSIEPPPGLWAHTMARLTEYRSHHLPAAPASLPAYSPPRSRWRRPDVLVAAGILLCVCLLIPPGLNMVRDRHNVLACQNNLRVFYTGLKDYSERHHGEFPDVATAAPEPRNVAGTFVPILNEEQLLPATVSVDCPARGRQPPSPLSLHDLEEMGLDEFRRHVPLLAGCYAYALGYRDEQGIVHGLRLNPDQPEFSVQPIMADRPPLDVAFGNPANSPNHGGRGQNVLYTDGHCMFWTARTVGVAGDDIYLNQEKKVGAGKTPWDSVLAGSAARP